MKLKPNRPVRVGTQMVMTDSKGELPGSRKAADARDAKGLNDMTKAELSEEAARRGIDVSGDTKAEIVAKLEAAA